MQAPPPPVAPSPIPPPPVQFPPPPQLRPAVAPMPALAPRQCGGGVVFLQLLTPDQGLVEWPARLDQNGRPYLLELLNFRFR